MATKTKQSSKSSARRAAGPDARKALEESMERVNRSLDAAEVAAKDLRSGVAKGSRDLVQDLERTLRHARTNARRVGKAVTRDLAHTGRAKPGTKRAGGRRS